jgi:sugar phosphate isomerase/epimerase
MITQRVWTPDPWIKLQRARAAAVLLGANTVVVHPPFRWQRDYARGFSMGIERMYNETDVKFAVENMFPLRFRGREISPYLPTWDVAGVAIDPDASACQSSRNTESDGYWVEPPSTVGPAPQSVEAGSANSFSLNASQPVGYRHFTLDLSHTSVSNSDASAMLTAMGAGMTHLHIADGTGLTKDEHLVPGRGNQPCAEVLESLAAQDFAGNVIVEVNTRRAVSRDEREGDLAEALAYCRLHLAAPVESRR